MRGFMQKQWHHHRERLAIIGVAFLLLAGFVQSAFGLEYVLKLTPILLTGIVCIAVAFWDAPVRAKLWASGIVVIGSFALEVIGVQTGKLFGDYTYGNILGFTVLGVPLTIGVTWLLVTLSAWHIAALNKASLLQRMLLGGVLVVMFDIILEQFAVAYGLWSWQGNAVPLFNYVCWFLISLLWFFVFHKFAPKAQSSFFVVSVLPMMAVFFWLMLVIA